MKRSSISLTKTGQFGPTGVLVNSNGTSVQLRQTVTGDGLTVSSGNNHNGQLGNLNPESRHLEGYSSTRTVLFPVKPGTTAEQVEAELAKAPDACLYYMISDDVRDILGANQLANMDKPGYKTQAEYERDLRPVNTATGAELGFYRATYFSPVATADVDLRIRAKVAVPAAAPAELAQTPAAVPAAAEKAPF